MERNKIYDNWGGDTYPSYAVYAQTPPVQPIEMTPEQIRALAAGNPPQPQPSPAPQPAPQPVPQPQPQPQQPPVQQPPAPTAAPATGQPTRLADGSWELRLPTGQVYKGANEQALITALATAQVNASERIRQVTDEATRFRAGLEAVTGRRQDGGNGQPTGGFQFDPAVYRELSQSDPMLAFQYQMGALFGVDDINEVIPTVRKVLDNSTKYEVQTAINQFRAQAPDFPGTQDAINKVVGFMKDKNIPFNADNLLLVHQGMVARGEANGGYKPLAPGQIPPGMAVPANPYAQPVAQPAAQPGTQPTPALVSPDPQGLYFFGPDGFGSRPPAPVPQPTAPAPVAQPASVAQPSAYPPAPAPVAVPGFPSMPTPAAVPMPAAPIGAPSNSVPTGQLTEDQIAAMPRDQLRQYIESNLQR